jgi:hypothetical protein
MGIAGLMTINSGRLLEIFRIETGCPPLVTTTVAAELCVFTVTVPKLSEAGLTPTPAWTGTGKNSAPTRSIAIDRQLSRILFMRDKTPRIRLKSDARTGKGAYQSPLMILISRASIRTAGFSDYWRGGQFWDRCTWLPGTQKGLPQLRVLNVARTGPVFFRACASGKCILLQAVSLNSGLG